MAEQSSDAGEKLLEQFGYDFTRRQTAAAVADHSEPLGQSWQDASVFLDFEVHQLLLNEYCEPSDDLLELSAILDYWRNLVNKAIQTGDR